MSPTITDDIGVWNDLGTITPSCTDWIKFPNTATGANATLRATYFCSDFSKVKSWCWLRARYRTGDSDQVSQSIRLYPKADKQLIEFPIPQDLQDRSVYFRDFEVRKFLKLRRSVGITPDIIWQIKLEELWG
jgi:hypothetical protein